MEQPHMLGQAGSSSAGKDCKCLVVNKLQGPTLCKQHSAEPASHVLRSHANMKFTPDKYLHGRRMKSSVRHDQRFLWDDSQFSGQCYPWGSLCEQDLVCAYGRWSVHTGRLLELWVASFPSETLDGTHHAIFQAATLGCPASRICVSSWLC